MKVQRITALTALLAATTCAGIATLPPAAQAAEASRWSVKTGIALVDTGSPFVLDKPSGGQVHAGGNAELGVSIAAEYRLTELIGLEVATVFAKSPDIDDTTDANNNEIGEGPSFVPVIAGVNFHLVDSAKIDMYVGPRVAFVQFGDFDLNIDGQNTAFDVDSEFAWGATAGINYRIGDGRWSLIAEATYLDVDMNITQQGESTSIVNRFDPLIVNLGASFRF